LFLIAPDNPKGASSTSSLATSSVSVITVAAFIYITCCLKALTILAVGRLNPHPFKSCPFKIKTRLLEVPLIERVNYFHSTTPNNITPVISFSRNIT
jgi:hypothetical protein